MQTKKNRDRLLNILKMMPELKEIFLSKSSLENKRENIRNLLSKLILTTFSDNQRIPPLEWIMARDAVRVFLVIVSPRSERLTGFSLLKYIDGMANASELSAAHEPHPGFFAELEHLLKGVTGSAGIYDEKVPSFAKHQGRKAARLRSADLSRMAQKSQKFMARYACGLDTAAIRRRSRNKTRILSYFNATDFEWEKWIWHTRNIIRDADTVRELVKLSKAEYQAIRLARELKIPFGITPYYLSLLDPDPADGRDRAVRAQVIPSLQYIESLKKYKDNAECSMDFMLERDTSPIDGITRRYPEIVILKPVMTCPQICVYCQRNWEIEDVYSQFSQLPEEKLKKAIQWIAETPEIKEVLITGGDPLLLSNKKIERLLYDVSKIKHVERIRIGTRIPVTLPQRITDALVRSINRFHIPGKQEILIVTHFEHPYEITPHSMEAVQKFRRYGMGVYNQLVYTFFNSRKFEAAILRHKLRLIGVSPYYTFNTKGKQETDEYRVPIARLLQEQQEEARVMPGTVRTDEIVFNVPKLGKNYLRASQHHDIISILPDGRRVYEFHPWEEKLSLADTYVYTDVSLYDYLKRLKAIGENLQDYKTIWYYY